MEYAEGILCGQVAIVTGAAQGMGAASAGALAREGVRVVVCDLDGEKAAQVAREIDPSGERTLGSQTDVAREEEVEALVATTLERFGKVDILVNNAGIYQRTPLESIEEADWDRELNPGIPKTRTKEYKSRG